MSLILSAGSFIVAVLAHAHWARSGGSMTITARFISIAAPVGAGLSILVVVMFGATDAAVGAILLYAVACELYIFLFTLVANGVAVSLLLRLSKRAMSSEDIDRAYNTRAMVERRVSQMIDAGLLLEKDELLVATFRGRRLAHLYQFGRRAFGHAE
jgi:hypothetical protein